MNEADALSALSKSISDITEQHAVGVLQLAYRMCCSVAYTHRTAGRVLQADGAAGCANALAEVIAKVAPSKP